VISFDFRLAPVESSVNSVIRKIDEKFLGLGMERRNFCQKIEIENDIIDVDVAKSYSTSTIHEAEAISDGWIGRTQLYTYSFSEKFIEITLYVWHANSYCQIVLGIERDDVNTLKNSNNPFQVLGSLACSAAKELKESNWGIMSVDEDLGELTDSDLNQAISDIRTQAIEPTVFWISKEKSQQIEFVISDLPSSRHFVETLDGFYLVFNDQGVEKLTKIC